MNNYKMPVTLLLILVILYAVSCKKKSSAPPFSNSLIARVDYSYLGAAQHYRIVYDQYDNVDSIVFVGGGTDTGSNGYKVMTYAGSSFTVTDAQNNSVFVEANTAGMILEVQTVDTLIMNYNTSNQLDELDTKSPINAYPFYAITSLYYNWTNGDVTSYSGSDTGSYIYYLSQPGQPGDPFRISAFLNYGRSYIKTNNLPKGLIKAGDTLYSYYYQFNPLGQISQMQVVNHDPTGIGYDTAYYNYRYY